MFKNANLNFAVLSNSDLSHSEFYNCNLSNVTLSGINSNFLKIDKNTRMHDVIINKNTFDSLSEEIKNILVRDNPNFLQSKFSDV